MALTKEDLDAIKEIIKSEIKTEIKPLETKIDNLGSLVSKLDSRLSILEVKVDTVTMIVTDTAKKAEALMKFVPTANAYFDPLKKVLTKSMSVHRDEDKKEG